MFKTSGCDIKDKSIAWKKREAGLLLLGSFSNDIIVYNMNQESDCNVELLL